jgi:hypothetical protein
VKTQVMAVCAVFALTSSSFGLTQAKIKRGPSYRDAEKSFGGAIRLDKSSVGGGNRIRIVLIAPDANINPGGRDVVGDGRNGEVTVKTRNGKLENYPLVETGPNTGIFYGYVTLKSGADDSGLASGGKGPYYGAIRANGQQDGLSVYWKPPQGGTITQYSELAGIRSGRSSGAKPETVIGSVGIGATLARVGFDQNVYVPGASARIRVHDPDMNKNPDGVDTITVFVFSESDIAGVRLSARETRASSGMFEASVAFTSTQASGGGRLRAQSGDKIYGLYSDATLPKPYGKNEVKKLEAVAQVR